MNFLQKLIAFIKYVLPWTKSTIKDAMVILEAVEDGIDMLEDHYQYPFSETRTRIKRVKESL